MLVTIHQPLAPTSTTENMTQPFFTDSTVQYSIAAKRFKATTSFIINTTAKYFCLLLSLPFSSLFVPSLPLSVSCAVNSLEQTISQRLHLVQQGPHGVDELLVVCIQVGAVGDGDGSVDLCVGRGGDKGRGLDVWGVGASE